jgi:hypothetical protein
MAKPDESEVGESAIKNTDVPSLKYRPRSVDWMVELHSHHTVSTRRGGVLRHIENRRSTNDSDLDIENFLLTALNRDFSV